MESQVQDLFCGVSAAKQKTQVAESWSQDAYDYLRNLCLVNQKFLSLDLILVMVTTVNSIVSVRLTGMYSNLQGCTIKAALDRQDLCCTYLAHHELESFHAAVSSDHHYC